jgi:phosphatidylserine/phosphatidylglycerophosphate/cardiolipin synthase-like enzyme
MTHQLFQQFSNVLFGQNLKFGDLVLSPTHGFFQNPIRTLKISCAIQRPRPFESIAGNRTTVVLWLERATVYEHTPQGSVAMLEPEKLSTTILAPMKPPTTAAHALAAALALLFLPKATAQSPIRVYFSPGGGCTDAILAELNHATNSIFVQAYTFTSAPIAKALLEAHKRGVPVFVLLDASQRNAQYSSADFLRNSGITPKVDATHAIAHNKVMVIDQRTVITGSFNFTKAAEDKNAENLLVISDTQLAAQYLKNWRTHAEHSEAYEGRKAEVTKKSR